MTDVVKPCEMPCPKCGSQDALRRFFARDKNVEPFSGKQDYGVMPVPRWIYGSAYVWKANRDFVAHFCRTCKHIWQTPPLPKPKRQKPAPTAQA
jgi:hypothetical protein